MFTYTGDKIKSNDFICKAPEHFQKKIFNSVQLRITASKGYVHNSKWAVG